MGLQSRNVPSPPNRKWWVERMSPADRRSHLIAERLETLAVGLGSRDAASIRTFLVRWRKATEGNNPAGFTLIVRVVPKASNHAIVTAELPGMGRVKWLPALVVPMSHHFTQIMRECGDLPLFPKDRERRTDAWGEPEKKGGFPAMPEVNIRLVYSQ